MEEHTFSDILNFLEQSDLAVSGREQAPMDSGVSEQALKQFIAGRLQEEERDNMIQNLLRNTALRQRLVEMIQTPTPDQEADL